MSKKPKSQKRAATQGSTRSIRTASGDARFPINFHAIHVAIRDLRAQFDEAEAALKQRITQFDPIRALLDDLEEQTECQVNMTAEYPRP